MVGLNAGLVRYRRWNAPFDHHDLQGVVYEQARNHGIAEDRKRPPLRQRQEPRKTHACQDRAYDHIRNEGDNQRFAGHRRPECAAFAR
jgi:hypothetical protein